MDIFLKEMLDMATWTGEFYKNNYVKQIDYLVKVTSRATATTQNSNSRPYSLMQDIHLPYPGETMDTSFMDQPTPSQRLHAVHTANDAHHLVDWRLAIKDFFTSRGDAPVAFFGHNIWWYMQYLLRPCDTYKMAYSACHAPRYSMTDSLALCLYIYIGMKVLYWMTSISIPMMIKGPLLTFCFLVFRYDFVPRCLPVLPLCLVSDIQWLLEAPNARCLCQLVPALVTNPELCTPDNCGGIQNGIIYASCPTSELGIFYPLVFFIRLYLPTLYMLMFGHDYSPLNGLKTYIPTIKAFQDDIQHGVMATDLQITCANLGVFDVILVIIAIRVLIRVLVPATKAVAETGIAVVGALSIASPVLFFQVEEGMEASQAS